MASIAEKIQKYENKCDKLNEAIAIYKQSQYNANKYGEELEKSTRILQDQLEELQQYFPEERDDLPELKGPIQTSVFCVKEEAHKAMKKQEELKNMGLGPDFLPQQDDQGWKSKKTSKAPAEPKPKKEGGKEEEKKPKKEKKEPKPEKTLGKKRDKPENPKLEEKQSAKKQKVQEPIEEKKEEKEESNIKALFQEKKLAPELAKMQNAMFQVSLPKHLQELKQKNFVVASEQQQMFTLIKIMKNLPISIFFKVKVDPIKLKIPDYVKIIKKPMDLGTMTKKLNQGSYTSSSEFISDMRQIFMNAVIFNHPQAGEVYFYAIMASNYFEDLLRLSQHRLSVPQPITLGKGTMWNVTLGWKRADFTVDVLSTQNKRKELDQQKKKELRKFARSWFSGVQTAKEAEQGLLKILSDN